MPLPSDVWVVVMQQRKPEKMMTPPPDQIQQVKVEMNKLEISQLNTILIGDYMSVALGHNFKWLVQVQGNAIFASTVALVKDGMLIVDRHYVFFQRGGNQVRTSDKTKLY